MLSVRRTPVTDLTVRVGSVVLPSPIITIDNVVKFYNPDSTF